MKQLWWVLAVLLTAVAFSGGGPAGAADDKKADEKKADPKAAPEPPPPPVNRQYSHVTDRGNKCVFVLNGKDGTCDFVFNGVRRKGELAYKRFAEMPEGPQQKFKGWIFQVVEEKKDQPIWFFFSDTPVTNFRGHTVYPMYYSATAPNAEGKQPWTRILTAEGTKAGEPGKEEPKKDEKKDGKKDEKKDDKKDEKKDGSKDAKKDK